MYIADQRHLERQKLKDDLSFMYHEIFGSVLTPDGYETLMGQNHLIVLLAYMADEPAGFKVGYTYSADPETFYSWIGGTLPSFRRQGIAWALMQEQHRRVKEMGISVVETKSRPRWQAMLKLNEKAGFELMYEYQGKSCGKWKYQFRKVL